MLTIKCASCKTKIWKYDKIGKGKVLRCHKSKITRKYNFLLEGNKVTCECGNIIGIDKGSYIKMIANSFVYSGTKR